MGFCRILSACLLTIFSLQSFGVALNLHCGYYQNLETGGVFTFPGNEPVDYDAVKDCEWCYYDDLQNRTYLDCSPGRQKNAVQVHTRARIARAVQDCDCGWKNSKRIVNGENSGINEYPAYAALVDISTKEIQCGCTILSTRYVLTAAHCMRAIQLTNMAVLVGDWDFTTGTDTSASSLYKAQNYWEHPGFQTSTKINDLAIVKTDKPIIYSLKVGPTCLPFSYLTSSFSYEVVTLLGWGQLFYGGSYPNILQKVQVQVTTNAYCKLAYNKNISDSQICTYTSGKDSCQGDSGGPLFWQDPNTHRVYTIGIISNGYGCATTTPAQNTRVTSYLEWIVSKISDVSFCPK